MNKLLSVILFSIVLFACSKKGEEKAGLEEAKTYQNPILNQNFADPTVIKAPDGYYYAYGTNAKIQDQSVNIQVAKSKDLIKWNHLGNVLIKPNWASEDFWAPHVQYDEKQKKYFMYYSGESDDATLGKCLGVAVSDSARGPFIDKGTPLFCGEGFVNIDPVAFDDPKTRKRLLYWGSGFEPIKVQELAEDRLSFLENTTPKDVLFPNMDHDYDSLIEGAWVTFQNDKYYLYYSGNNCCGERAHYGVMVARADNPFGPFQRFSEVNGGKSSVILEQKDYWRAPGHNSIVEDESGNEWIVYHAMTPENKNDRIMLMDPIVYKNGWPSIKDGKPSTGTQPAPKYVISKK